MITNGMMACERNGGIRLVKINLDELSWGKFKFVCNNGMETDWWSEVGNKGKLLEAPEE
jgi:hypothetical protein